MELSNNLLVIIDPTKEDHPALAQATIMAKILKLDIDLFITDYDSNLLNQMLHMDLDDINHQIKNYLKNYESMLENLSKPLREQGFKVNTSTAWDYPLYESIIRHATKRKPFMILKDTHHHNKLSRKIFKSTDWNLIRACPFPILFVKNNRLWRRPTITCSVNPVDDEHISTHHDEDILQYGKLFVNEFEGDLQIYHAYHSILDLPYSVFPWGGQFNTIFTDDVDQQIRQSHRQALYKLADKLNIDHSSIKMEDGEAKFSLPEFIENTNSDLLIMGTHCSSRFEQVLIGGTAETVLDEVDCDILVLHEAGFETPVKNLHPVLIK